MAAGETLARVRPLAQAIGVTRLADIGGLDRIGVPLFQAIRPMARSLSVSQGKGLTADAARVSALCEAIELHCAETVRPTATGPATPAEGALWRRLPPARGQPDAFDPARVRAWLHGVDLLTGRSVRVPHGLVSMDCTVPREADLWPNTNGLAAGNDRAEAETAALCELIERDAHARWLAATPAARRRTAIDPATIEDRAGRWLLARLARAGLRVALWDMSAAHGIAAIGCALIEGGPAATLVLPPAFGAGCHPRRAAALVRAVCEAAQTRAALIAGSRDDLSPRDYADPGDQRAAFARATRDFGGGPLRGWQAVPDHAMAPPAARDRLLRVCADAGCGAVPCVDLSPASGELAVVRLIAPLFGDHDRPSRLPPLA